MPYIKGVLIFGPLYVHIFGYNSVEFGNNVSLFNGISTFVGYLDCLGFMAYQPL